MSAPRWTPALVLVALAASAALAGCTRTDADRPDPHGDPGREAGERLAVEPVAPAGTEVVAEVGETVTFVVECEPPGFPEEVVVEWEQALRGEGVDDREQHFQSSAEPSAFAVTFEAEGEHVVTAACVTDDDRTVPHLWNVTVGADRSDGATGSGPAGNLTVHVVDVGQGDGIVVHFPDHTIVYDTGRWHGESETAVRDHLLAEGATPDALVVSHPDADHAGGCDLLLETFDVDAVYHPGIAKDTQTWADCERAMRAENAAVHAGEALTVGQAMGWTSEGAATLIHVDPEAEDPNEGSIALELAHGSFEMVLTGDIGCDTEERILEGGLVGDVEVVQVGHHGSRTSTCGAWLDATWPEAGVISVGENNYGHPHEAVLDRLAARDVDVYRTDTHGTIAVTSNGTSWSIGPAADDARPRGADEASASAPALNVTARVDDPHPCQYTDVTVTIAVRDGNGTPVEGANTTSTWHYASSSPTENGTTNATGQDAHTRYISGAKAGREVPVDVRAEAGEAAGEAEAGFTPRAC